MLSGISSRELASLSGRAGRPPAASADRAGRPRAPPAGRGGRRSAAPAGRAGRAPGPSAERYGRSPVRSPVPPPVQLVDRGAAAGRGPAPRGPGRRGLAGAPPAALRAERRPRLSLPPPAGGRPLVDAPGLLAASDRGARPGARAPVVPPRVRSLAGRPGRAADWEPRAPPGDSPPDDPYRRPDPPVSRFCPAPDGRLAPPVPLRPAVGLRAVPPEPLWPAPPRREAPPVPLRSAVGLRLAPPAALRPVPLVPFRGAPVFRPTSPVPLRLVPPLLARSVPPEPLRPVPPLLARSVPPLPPVPPRAARDGAWPGARGPVRRAPPARSGRPPARPRPCSPVTLSSAPMTQFPESRATPSSGQDS